MANPFEQFAASTSGGNPFASFASAPAEPQMSGIEAGLRGAAQGITGNWSDEAYGYGTNLGKLLTQGKDAYLKAAEEDTKSARESNKRAREQHPGKFLGGEVAGAILPTAAAMLIPGGQPAAVANGARLATQATTIGSRMAQGAKVGAGYGAAYGAGAAEAPAGASFPEQAANTAVEAGKGLAIGGTIGALASPLLDVAGAAVKPITNIVRAKMNPEAVAADKVAEAFRRDGAGPLTLNNPILNRDGGTILADMGGENVRGKMRSALNVPNEGRTAFQEQLDGRARDQWNKIESSIVDVAGDPKKYYQSADALIATRAAEATPAFERAFDASFLPHEQKFTDLFARPTFDKIKNRVEDALLDEGVKGAPRTGEVFNNVRPLEVVHRIKVELDKQIGQAAKAEKMGNAGGASADKFDLNTLMTLKNDLRSALKASSGDGPELYSRALKSFGDSSALSRAIELGFDHAASKEAPEVVRRTLAKMSPPEQELYRLGVARKWAEQNRTGRDTADRVGRDWTSPERNLMLEEVARTPEARTQFKQMMDALAAQTKTRQAAQGNSTTAKQLLEAADDAKPAEVLKMGKNVVMGNWSALMEGLAQKAAPLGGMTPGVAAEMLKILGTKTSPVAQKFSGATPQWPALNIASGLPSINRALDRRAVSERMRGILGDAVTRGSVGLLSQ